MRRRDFLAGVGVAATVWPAAAQAQSVRKPIIGFLYHSNPEPGLGQIRAALGRLGYREGETIQYEVRVANGSDARLGEMAAELVAQKVDVLVAVTTPAVIAAKAATTVIPIVMGLAADPVGSGLVTSLSRPGGNITGVSGAAVDMASTLLGLLREALPSAGRIGVLVNVADPFHLRLVEGIETANRSVKVDLQVFGISRPDEIDAAFEQMAARKIDAAIIQPTLPRQAVIALAIRYRLPTASPTGGYAHLGGFLSYSDRSAEVFAVAATQVDQILKGAKPADIPVRQPTTFDLVLNLKTARSIGLTVSPLLLAQADEVIE